MEELAEAQTLQSPPDAGAQAKAGAVCLPAMGNVAVQLPSVSGADPPGVEASWAVEVQVPSLCRVVAPQVAVAAKMDPSSGQELVSLLA